MVTKNKMTSGASALICAKTKKQLDLRISENVNTMKKAIKIGLTKSSKIQGSTIIPQPYTENCCSKTIATEDSNVIKDL